MDKIMIFGASGFLGSALTNSLSDKFTVLAVVRPDSDTWRLESHSAIVIRESIENWPKLVKEHSPRIVICAQWNGTEVNSRDNSELQNSNINQIEQIAEVSRVTFVSTFIAFGSQAETSKTSKSIPEEFVSNPASAYGATKVKLLQNLINLFQDSNTRFVWARVFSIFGPSETGETLIPNLLRAANAGESLKLLNPTLLWSYLYIEDFVSAVDTLITTKEISGIVNIGNKDLVTIESICRMVPKGSYITDGQMEHSPHGYFPSVARLMHAGWQPRYSLSEALRITSVGIIKKLGLRNLDY